MKLIAAVDENWGIGLKNKLLFHIPADQKFFRRETLGKVVVMGRRTLESLPGSRPLEGRRNIVLSSTLSEVCGAAICRDLDALFDALSGVDGDDVYVIGGGKVYQKLCNLCDRALITRVDRAYECDTYFPNLDMDKNWVLEKKSDEQTYFDLIYHFLEYKNIGS